MKRYLVFTFIEHESNGGWEDFDGSCDTVDDAKALIASMLILENGWIEDCQIVDGQTGIMVLDTRLADVDFVDKKILKYS